MTCGSRTSVSAGGGKPRWAAERARLGAGPAKRSWAGPKAATRGRGGETGGRRRTSQELGHNANGLERRPGREVSFSFFFSFLLLFPF
jgi:hypothetical protein